MSVISEETGNGAAKLLSRALERRPQESAMPPGLRPYLGMKGRPDRCRLLLLYY